MRCLAPALLLLAAAATAAQPPALRLSVRPSDGAFALFAPGLPRPVLVAGVGAEVNRRWLRSALYPRHTVLRAPFRDALGAGQQLTIAYSGLAGAPELILRLRLYASQPYGDLRLTLRNSTRRVLTVAALRLLDAAGPPFVSLGGPAAADCVLAETVSEDPPARIGGLAAAPAGGYTGVRDLLLYNRASGRSLLLAAVSEARFLTVVHLAARGGRIAALTVENTGATRAMLGRTRIPPAQRVFLRLPLAPGASLRSELVMFAVEPGFLPPLEQYGAVVRRLYGLDFSHVVAPMGWWSWTAFYARINQRAALANARLLARRLLPLGYRFFHLDEGYGFARGDYLRPNSANFPGGLAIVERRIAALGLIPALWAAPFEVGERAWVYRHHRDWLLRDDHGQPIRIGFMPASRERLFVLDATNPAAQAYLRLTYRTLTHVWGVKYLKLDFMDATAIEGDYYRPLTTALQGERIGLGVIRRAVGPAVLLDKDGSAMLAPVGLVDEGRIAPDTGHSFAASRDAVVNLAARFYMNRNFYVADPDAFSVSRQLQPRPRWHEARRPLTLGEAQVQIVLAALAGGLYEIGDDLRALIAEPARLALVANPALIAINRSGRAALPLDLMTFPPADLAPSVFYLPAAGALPAYLTVFNWTDRPAARTLTPPDGWTRASDVLAAGAAVALRAGRLHLLLPPHSVRLLALR